MPKADALRPVILSGGAGTRLWPVSRQTLPKQFHALTSRHSLFQEALLRLGPQDGAFAAPIILASAAHETLIREQLAAIDVTPGLLLLEPAPKNTAPAIAAVALAVDQEAPDGILAVLPADHMIADAGGFRAALMRAAAQAAQGRIVTLGINPGRAETGYGYICAGEEIGGGVRTVESFKEKPDADTAMSYLAAGNYYWNAGVFVFQARVMLEELQRHCPATLDAVSRALNAARQSPGALTLDAEAFAEAEADSLDYAVMEHTGRAAVVPADIGWSDIGSWAALWEGSEKRADGNASRGDEAILLDCTNLLTFSEGPMIAAIGVSDLVIVATPDGVLVARREKAQEVKKVVEQLRRGHRTDLL